MSEALVHTDFFGVYLHAPFCAARCGYRDFNTYIPDQLGSGVTQGGYFDAIVAELEMVVVKYLEPVRGADTVFVGGGTPSMLGVNGLCRLLDGVRNSFGLADDVEATVESNPELTSSEFFEGLTEAGFIRASLGMQSAVLHVLTISDRTHTPGCPTVAVAEARAAGFKRINPDVICGMPGESMADLDTTLEVVLTTEIGHVSAYLLTVEPGTAMARKVYRGELPMPDNDDLVDRYECTDVALNQAGFSWYEVLNWVKPGGQYRHSTTYWHDGNWWGAGSGVHLYPDGTRFHNAKHPIRYAATISGGELSIKDSEELAAEDRHTEKIMLGLRLVEGIDTNLLGEDELGKACRQAEAGMVEFVPVDGGQRIQLTNRGRLLTGAIIVDILS